jgi:hypothetical protein
MFVLAQQRKRGRYESFAPAAHGGNPAASADKLRAAGRGVGALARLAARLVLFPAGAFIFATGGMPPPKA